MLSYPVPRLCDRNSTPASGVIASLGRWSASSRLTRGVRSLALSASSLMQAWRRRCVSIGSRMRRVLLWGECSLFGVRGCVLVLRCGGRRIHCSWSSRTMIWHRPCITHHSAALNLYRSSCLLLSLKNHNFACVVTESCNRVWFTWIFEKPCTKLWYSGLIPPTNPCSYSSQSHSIPKW